MEPDLHAATLHAWARLIDDGPFSSLCFGERIAFDNPETLTLLGALAAWTQRVRLVTTVVVPQLHDPVMLAKALATSNMLGRRTAHVGLGIGGRHEDYRAVGADPATQTIRGMAERVAVMKRVWAQEKVTDSVCPVGPPPLQRGGPELLVGTLGPKTVRSAAQWANRLAGTTLDLDVGKVNELFDVAAAPRCARVVSTGRTRTSVCDPVPASVGLDRPVARPARQYTARPLGADPALHMVGQTNRRPWHDGARPAAVR